MLNEEIIRYLLAQLAISVKIIKASSLNIRTKGTGLLTAVCRRLGADEYIYGKHGADYMEFDEFTKNRIKLIPDNFTYPHYNQVFEPFVENMSVVDLLFNEGENSAKILKEVSA